jgi:hypothetical protein
MLELLDVVAAGCVFGLGGLGVGYIFGHSAGQKDGFNIGVRSEQNLRTDMRALNEKLMTEEHEKPHHICGPWCPEQKIEKPNYNY